MTEMFKSISHELANFLHKHLSELSDDWWQKHVIQSLSSYYRDKMSRSDSKGIFELDLAPLLKILDANWFYLTNSLDLSQEDRHYQKEMLSIRNRWAHVNSFGVNQEDQYRDMDTIQRFLQVINAERSLIDAVISMKKKLLSELGAGPGVSTLQQVNSDEYLAPGKEIRLKSNHDYRAVIMDVLSTEPETIFQVYGHKGKENFFESQIELVPANPVLNKLTFNDFKAQLTAVQISKPAMNTLYSLNSARIEFIPYQFRPVLKFIHADRPRILIADSVGVGKTIEAGLILRELQARRDVQSVLVICPKPLIVERKWISELKRFDERFTHIDGKELRWCIDEYETDGVWPDKHRKAIIPYSLFDDDLLNGTRAEEKIRTGLLDLNPPPQFDLLIVDEAHHIRNEHTANHKAVKFFCDNAEAVVFLTATPLQTGDRDLFVLLNTLRPDLIINEENFSHMSEPNSFINNAAKAVRYSIADWENSALDDLNKAIDTPWGKSILSTNPIVSALQLDLNQGGVSPERRVQMISELENLHSFNNIINRTRRRDIQSFTIRNPVSCNIDFTPEQEYIHSELLDIHRRILLRLHHGTSVNFMMTTIRRQAASCIFGLVPFLKDILSRHINELEFSEIDPRLSLDESYDSIVEQIDSIIDLCKDITDEDPKLDVLKQIVRDKQTAKNPKIMLFSSFKHTLTYLYNNLVADGYPVGLITGATADEERVRLRKCFEKNDGSPGSINIMLFSEVGCEGLDYQFCDTIVNYDLPWNPMRIEQRIGRIDRRGQKSPKVMIYNLVTPGTIDGDIYERCLSRIGVFENSIGDSEEILGEISTQLKNIGENLNLSEAERAAQLQQLADNQIRLIQEELKLEQQQHQLFGIDIPSKANEEDIQNASSYWLSPKLLEHSIQIYLRKRLEQKGEFILGEKLIKTLRLSSEARNVLLNDYRSMKLRGCEVARKWEQYLLGGDQFLPLTFDQESAMEDSSVVFVNSTHPLTKQAAQFLSSDGLAYTTIKFNDPEMPSGTHDFAVYQWQFMGLRDDTQLVTICSSEELGKGFSKVLETAEDCEWTEEITDTGRWSHLDKLHYEKWKRDKDKHKRKINDLVAYQKESISTTHSIRIAYLEGQLNKVSEARIQRMRKAELVKAEADYIRRIQELELAVEKSDIIANVLMFGIITNGG